MIDHKHHQIFIGLMSIIFFVIGLLIGASLAMNLGTVDLEGIKMGLMFTTIILLLMIGSLVLDIKKILQYKKKRK